MSKLKVTIDEDKWYAANNPAIPECGKQSSYEPVLCNKKYQKCCLGFVAHEEGIPYKAMIKYDIGLPYTLFKNMGLDDLVEHSCLVKFKKDSVSGEEYIDNTEFSKRAYHLNDDFDISFELKKKGLKALGKKHGVEFEFVKVKS